MKRYSNKESIGNFRRNIETEKRIKELSKSIKPVKSAYFKKYNRSRSRSRSRSPSGNKSKKGGKKRRITKRKSSRRKHRKH